MGAYKLKKGISIAIRCLPKFLQQLLQIELLLLLWNVIIIGLVMIYMVLHVRFGGPETGLVHVGGVGLEQSLLIIRVLEDAA